jgi:hypothetical protein
MLRLLLAAEACGPAALERAAHGLVAQLLEQTLRVVREDEVRGGGEGAKGGGLRGVGAAQAFSACSLLASHPSKPAPSRSGRRSQRLAPPAFNPAPQVITGQLQIMLTSGQGMPPVWQLYSHLWRALLLARDMPASVAGAAPHRAWCCSKPASIGPPASLPCTPPCAHSQRRLCCLPRCPASRRPAYLGPFRGPVGARAGCAV